MANAAVEVRRSGNKFVFIVLGIFHFHAVFVFWLAVRRSLPRPRTILSLPTGCFVDKSSGTFGKKVLREIKTTNFFALV
jgi:hypothetical protein